MFPFSVIIPIYNAVPFLEFCLQSLLCTLPSQEDAEIILVNDGSTDGSLSICRRYEAQYPHIRVVDLPHRGVAAARNAGLEAARGSYIAWVDADDLVSPDWFSAISHAAKCHQPDVIVMDRICFREKAAVHTPYRRQEGFIPGDMFFLDVCRDIRIHGGLPDKVIRADLYSGIHFDEGLPLLEDFAILPAILRNARTVYHICQPLYRYRQHHASLLHQVTSERAFCSFEIASQRAAALPPPFRQAAETAAATQALRFCCAPYAPQDSPGIHQTRRCIRYVRRKLPVLLCDPDIPHKLRLRLLLLAAGFPIPWRKSKNM